MTLVGDSTSDNSAGTPRAASRGSGTLIDVAGVPVRVRSNTPGIEHLARERHGAHAGTAHACTVEITLVDGPIAGPDEVRWQIGDDTLQLAASGLRAHVDLLVGAATVHVNEAFVRQRGMFQRCVLEGVPFTLLTRRDRHPVHASAVRAGDAALLLRGSSGVGKSTLAYTAHRAGMAVLSDDVCRVQLRPGPRIWGDTPRPMVHLLDDARTRFPELAGVEPAWMSGGGIFKLEVPLDGAHPPHVSTARVCLLRRAPGIAPRRRIAPPQEIRADLMDAPEARLDLFPEQRALVADYLSGRGGWVLEIGEDPAAAIPHLSAMLEETLSSPT